MGGPSAGAGQDQICICKRSSLPFPSRGLGVSKHSIDLYRLPGSFQGPREEQPCDGSSAAGLGPAKPPPTLHAECTHTHTLGLDGEMLPSGHQCPQLCPDLWGGWAEGAGAVLGVGGGGVGDKGGTEPVLSELRLRSAPGTASWDPWPPVSHLPVIPVGGQRV